MLQLQSCNPGIMSALSFRARFAGPYSKYDLPDVVMSGYLLNASEVNDNSTRFTFLFPLSYVDSIWQNETFDSMDIVCGGDASEDEACAFALDYAAGIPAVSILPYVTQGMIYPPVMGSQQFLFPVFPGQPLLGWICSLFPFVWCAPPSRPPLQPPAPIRDPPLDDGEDDDDYDYEGGGGEYPELRLLSDANAAVYEDPGSYVTASATVQVQTFPANLHYPVSAGAGQDAFPVIVFGHGLGGSSLNYQSTMRHLASHGFVVIAPDSFDLWTGADMLACVPWLEAEGANPASVLYGVVDATRVGLAGHSMGGAGAVRASLEPAYASVIKAVAPIYPAPIGGFFGLTQAPVFISAGASDLITPAEAIRASIFESGSLGGPKLYASLFGSGHLEPTDGFGSGGQAWRAYLTAWFRAYLAEDVRAPTLVWGASSDRALMNNPMMASLAVEPGIVIEAAPSYEDGDVGAIAGTVSNALEAIGAYGLWYNAAKGRIRNAIVSPDVTPPLAQYESSSFRARLEPTREGAGGEGAGGKEEVRLIAMTNGTLASALVYV